LAFQHPFLAPIIFWISSEYFFDIVFVFSHIFCGNPKMGNNSSYSINKACKLLSKPFNSSSQSFNQLKSPTNPLGTQSNTN
jgi:hypothetical protein